MKIHLSTTQKAMLEAWNEMDYLEIERRLAQIGQEHSISSAKKFPMKGHNFITNNVAFTGKIRGSKNHFGPHFELSYGTGMIPGTYFYGVTFCDPQGEPVEGSRACHSFQEVEETLEGKERKK